MGVRKIEKIFRINPIEKIWNYIKEHTKQGKQTKNESRNSKNTISFEERKRRILERESALKRQNQEIQKTRYRLSPEEIYRMERARVRRSERFNQLNQERNNVSYATKITPIEEKRRVMKQNRQQQADYTTSYLSIRHKKVIESAKREEEKTTMNTKTEQSNSTPILKYNEHFYRMQEAYHKTSSRRPSNESVIDYENRKSQITNTKKSTIIEFKQRYAVGSNECYQHFVNRANDTKVRNRTKGWDR